MSYQVLARKWRPKTFADLVGQEHVVKALQNALDKGRLHHAYLLTGTRGVGKTTIARILAKSLNCETPSHGEPCGQCPSCTAIDQGRFVDLLEIDAASNTGIDNIREVLENAQYAPTAGKYKVYIIDEVHMLSKSAFNAMLKTLEEPPGHVKFILATTDPHKVPITVLSRCLQFVLRNMTPAQVSGHLAHVLDSEQIAYDQASLALIGRAANGSMRDALSLLDQAIAMGSGSVAEADVRQMIGAADRRYLYTLLNALAARDGAAMIAEARQMAANAVGFDGALHDLAALLQQIALLQTVPQAADSSDPEHATLSALAQQFSGEQIQLYYQCLLHGRRDLPLAPDEYAGFVMTLLRMLAFAPFAAEAVPAGSRIEGVSAAPALPAAAVRQPESPKQPENQTDNVQAAAEPSASDAANQAAETEQTAAVSKQPENPASDIQAADSGDTPPQADKGDKGSLKTTTAAVEPTEAAVPTAAADLPAVETVEPENRIVESNQSGEPQRQPENPADAVPAANDDTPPWADESSLKAAGAVVEPAEAAVPAAAEPLSAAETVESEGQISEPVATAAPKQPESPKQPENSLQAADDAPPKRKSRSKKAAAETETPKQPENGFQAAQAVNSDAPASQTPDAGADPAGQGQPESPPPAAPMPELSAANWPLIAERIGSQVAAAQMLLRHTAWVALENGVLHLSLRQDKANAVVRKKEYFDRIAAALTQAYGRDFAIQTQDWQDGQGWETPDMYAERRKAEDRERARTLLEQDPTLRQIQETFGAKWQEQSLTLLADNPA